MVEIILTDEDRERRLDQALSGHLNVSRSQIQRWIEGGHVRIENKTLDAKSKWPAGTRVYIEPPPTVPDVVEAEPMDLDVLFEDEDVIVLNKKAGVSVHPGAGCRMGTLVGGLLHHCRGKLSGIGGVERPGIVHRLDKDTSGVMIAAKNDFAHQKLSEAFQQRRVVKIYRGYAHRSPTMESGSWREPLGRHPLHRQKQAVRLSGGREAWTDYRVLDRYAKYTFLQFVLHTGRTHQIRVHASHAGCPLVGDVAYGGSMNLEAGVKRQLLHACHLEIPHPRGGETLAISAPMPEDFLGFESWLKQKK
ncbi:MAG: RluA family pseudouridine synthase [Candidatus Methylacidiphilales bacterium]